ncbi:MAG: TIGR01777 family oxidoreductase [Bacteroidales bacterium]|nr:TIGR01777 family oxidoreductase [Bacteroidales bacterium]
MRILIFGGTGFIGSHLCRALAGEGHEVLVFSRNPGSLQPSGYVKAYEKWDPARPEDILRHFRGSFGVVNLAGRNIGSGVWTRRFREDLIKSRISVSSAIAEAASATREPPVFIIQSSATGYYGHTGEESRDERSAPGTGFLSGLTQQWEQELTRTIIPGCRIILMRTGIVLGREAGMLPLLTRTVRYFMGFYPGNGKQWVSWIHIEDMIRAILFLAGMDTAHGAYNLTSEHPVRMKALIAMIGHAIHRPVMTGIPSPLIRLLPGGMGKEMILVSQKVLPVRLLNEGFAFRFPEPGQAVHDLLKNPGT